MLNSSDKKELVLIVTAIVALSATFAYIYQRQVKNINRLGAEELREQPKTEEQDKVNSESKQGVGSRKEGQVTKENQAQGEVESAFGEKDQGAVNTPALEKRVVRDYSKKEFTNPEEINVKKTIDNFENYFASQNYALAFELFSSQVRVLNDENQIRSSNPPPTVGYEVVSIDIRNDKTALAQVIENRADNSIQRRFFELVPENDVYKISQYFSTENSLTPYAGFNVTLSTDQSSSDSSANTSP